MSLTFKSLKQPETVIVAGIELPKRGCLTVAEESAIRDFGATLKEGTEGMTPQQADLFIKWSVITIMFQSRCDRSWTFEQTKAPQWVVSFEGKDEIVVPDMAMLDELYEFFMGEQRRWQELPDEPQEEQNQGKKELTGTKSDSD